MVGGLGLGRRMEEREGKEVARDEGVVESGEVEVSTVEPK